MTYGTDPDFVEVRPRVYDAAPLADIDQVVRAGIAKAKEKKRLVIVIFNGISLSFGPDDSGERMKVFYSQEMQRLHDESRVSR